jgi:DNA-binding NtrC family response regulator
MATDSTRRRVIRALPLKKIRVSFVGAAYDASPVESVETIRVGTAPGNDLVLQDEAVSRYHLELERRGERIAVVDLGSTNGTYLGLAQLGGSSATVPPGTQIKLGDTTLLVDDGSVVTVDVPRDGALSALKCRTPSMQQLLATIARLSEREVSVLIVGESGTGKELIARAIHEDGPRRDQPFVTVDCGALPPALFAGALFGHERGAYTGADQRQMGAFERASGGTLFLDEIGELPAEIQATLLGVLERQRVMRLGAEREISVDVRVVAATHRDLRAEVNAGSFRLDLYYRLAVVQLSVPPLRERLDDIPLLVEHFLHDVGHDGPMSALFTKEDLAAFKRYRWPGNVRELRNVVASAMALGERPALDPIAEPPALGSDDDPIGRVLGMGYREGRSSLLREFEARYLHALLERADGNVRRAAREASMDRSYLTELLKRHKLK